MRRSGRDAAVRGPGWAASCSLNARGALDDLVHWHHDAARENRLSNARRKRALHSLGAMALNAAPAHHAVRIGLAVVVRCRMIT